MHFNEDCNCATAVTTTTVPSVKDFNEEATVCPCQTITYWHIDYHDMAKACQT